MWHIHVCEPATNHNTYSFHTSSVMYKYTLCKNNWSHAGKTRQATFVAILILYVIISPTYTTGNLLIFCVVV